MSGERGGAVNGFPVWFALFLVFLTFKLTETVGWSWWWITAPLWGPWALVLVVFVVLLVAAGVRRLTGARLAV